MVRGGGAGGGDGEGDGLARRNGLACWLCRNRRSHRRRIHRKRGRVAGHTSGRVADQHCELRPVVGTGRGWRGVGGRGGTVERDAVLPPLITQRGGARRGHAEGGSLTGGDRLV